MIWNSGDLRSLATAGSAAHSPAEARARAAAPSLEGKRVLVVEDEMLLALDLEEGLLEAGCLVVGPAGNLRVALRMAEAEDIDAAILDVNLAGERVFPVAQILNERGIPFVFATAYAGTEELYPADVKSAPRLAKPYSVAQAIIALRDAVAA